MCALVTGVQTCALPICAAAGPSVDPLHLSSVSDGSVSLSGERQYSYSGAQPSFSGSVQVSVGAQLAGFGAWLTQLTQVSPGTNINAFTAIQLPTSNTPLRAFMRQKAIDFFSQSPGAYRFTGSATAPSAVYSSATLAKIGRAHV